MIDYPRKGRTGARRWIPSWKLVLGSIFTFGLVLVAAGIAAFAFAWFTIDIPEENDVAQAQTTIIYWNDGKDELARIGDTNRISVPISDIPLDVQRAILAAEDRDFYEHGGFALTGFLRALWTNLTTGSSQGGSTITQQYAKNAYLNAEKTYIRKVRELILSMKIESTRTKDEILDDYLNTIYFGRGAYGIQTAAEVYFGKDAKDLTLEEGAVLASIINAPGAFSPEENMDRLKNRYRYVLDGMVQEGWISASERDDAVENFPEIKDRKRNQTYAGPNGFLISMVEKEVLARGFTETELYGGGLRITSTFDKQAQKAAVDSVAATAPTTNTEGLRIGLASVAPETGEVVAIYGGPDYLENSLNNATQAIAQAGSTFKPFALVAATEDDISPQSQWPGNSPTTTDGYTYQNYGNTSYGPRVSLLYGTEQSINSVFVTLESEVGVDAVRQAALDAGIPDTITGWAESDNLTFVLGTASPHAIDVANAYATFAARGKRAETTTLRLVASQAGKDLYRPEGKPEQTMRKNTADVVNWYLENVVKNGTGRPALALGRPAAGKTGSTDSYLSAWFAGYTPQLATAVMFSKDDEQGNPISLSGTGGMPSFYGGGYPARLWTAYMRGALKGQPVEQFTDPEDFPGGGGPTPTGSATKSESGEPSESASESASAKPTRPDRTSTAPQTTAPQTSAPPTDPTPAPETSAPVTTAPPEPTSEPTAEPTPEPPSEPASPDEGAASPAAASEPAASPTG